MLPVLLAAASELNPEEHYLSDGILIEHPDIDGIRFSQESSVGDFYALTPPSETGHSLARMGKAISITVEGQVTDQEGEPLIGVNIQIKGSSKGTSTDFDGNFILEDVDEDAVLVVSYVGYQTQEVPVSGKTSLSITMISDSQLLDEVIVVGYGTQKKSDVTGAALRIGAEELKSRPVANAIEGMQGKIAGVDISTNERPGQMGDINIRGVRSLTASNSPLFVVDGIPLMTGGIENINPTDIESIDVLKDASATAIYGSRGANGVIIVTTKQGQAGRFSINYSGSVTTQTLENRSQLTNAAEYIDYRRWAYYYRNPEVYPRGDEPTEENDFQIFLGASDPYAWENIKRGWEGGTWDGSRVETTDWTGMVTRPGISTEHTLSASGGTEQMKGYFSFGYLNDKGTSYGQNFNRYTGKANIEINPMEYFSLGGSINTSYGIQEYGQSDVGGSTNVRPSGIYDAARGNFPYTVPYDDNGERIIFPGGDDAIRTVVDEWKYSQDQRATFRAFGSLFAELNIGKISGLLDGLKYRLNFGPDISSYRNGVYIDGKSVIRTGSSYASLNKVQKLSYTLDNLVFYDKSVKNHNFGLTLLHSITDYQYESSLVDADNIPFASQKWNALTSSDVPKLNRWNSDLIENQLMSYMARLNYNLSQKYLLTLSGRWDGASQLAEGHKWAFFPSAALGWRLDQEDFLVNSSWIDDMKLRFGVGVTGNSAIDPYATKGGLSSLFYPFYTSEVAGTLPSSTLANQELGWEKTTQYNIGVDFSFFKNIVSGVIDVYTSHTKDLLLSMTIPSVTGYTSTFANVGETSNRGFDLTVNTRNIEKNNFRWETSLNLSWQKDRIESLATKDDDINNNWFIGEQIGVIYGYKYDGIWKKEDAEEMAKYNANGNTFEPGQIRPVDLNGDYLIEANNDRMVVGNTRPNWIAGMTNTVNFYNFDLSIFIYGRLGYMYDAGGESLTGRFNVRKVDYYTEINTDSEYQRPEFTEATGDPYYAIIGYMDGSFLKIRNISLGYNLSPEWISRMNISNFKIYAQVTNPGFIYSGIKFLDLDTGSGIWNRGFTLGLNIGL